MSTIEALKKLLKFHNINTSLYGKETLQELLQEINEEECTLGIIVYRDSNILARIVRELNIIIRDNNNGKILLETSQYFHSTSTSESYTCKKFTPFTVKMKNRETLGDACARGLKEKLGIIDESITNIINIRTEEKISELYPYPGLLTKYNEIIIVIKAPPQICGKSFNYTKCFSDGISPRLTTHWKWYTPSKSQSDFLRGL